MIFWQERGNTRNKDSVEQAHKKGVWHGLIHKDKSNFLRAELRKTICDIDVIVYINHTGTSIHNQQPHNYDVRLVNGAGHQIDFGTQDWLDMIVAVQEAKTKLEASTLK